jgi:hypothetical protein
VGDLGDHVHDAGRLLTNIFHELDRLTDEVYRISRIF